MDWTLSNLSSKQFCRFDRKQSHTNTGKMDRLVGRETAHSEWKVPRVWEDVTFS